MNGKPISLRREETAAEPERPAPLASHPLVSVVIPCRNEARFIRRCLESLLGGTYPRDALEILVVDGMSTDGTRALVTELQSAGPVRLIDNPSRITPCALNLGIANMRGTIFVRVDAHTVLPPDYVETVVTWLLATGADNVGVVCRTVPGRDTPMARAIATAMSHRFGVGNSDFRVGVTRAKYVDTVPFGCYRKELFAAVGWFDEELSRNQDDEFNARVLRHGGRILLVPDVTVIYVARDTLAQTANMFFWYGYFKPLVGRKVGRLYTWRQLVPPCFVAAVLGTLLGAPWSAVARLGFLLVAGAYGAGLAAAVIGAAGRVGLGTAARLACVFPVIHGAYGLGYLTGLPRAATAGRHPSRMSPVRPQR